MPHDCVAHLYIEVGTQIAFVLDLENGGGDDELHRGIIFHRAYDVFIRMPRSDILVNPTQSHVIGQVAPPLGHQETEGLIHHLILIDFIERGKTTRRGLCLVGTKSTLAEHDTLCHKGYAVTLGISLVKLLLSPRTQIGNQRIAEGVIALGIVIISHDHYTHFIQCPLRHVILSTPPQHYAIAIRTGQQMNTSLDEPILTGQGV